MSGTGIEVSPDMDPEEALAHYGKKGMKWGVTNDSDGGGSSGGGGKSKPSSDDIKSARENLRREAVDYHKARKEVKKTTAKGSVERAMGNEKIAEMKVDFLNNPDRATATRMTTGEKVVYGLLATNPIFTASVVGNVAGRAVGRKVIEKKQASGAYYK